MKIKEFYKNHKKKIITAIAIPTILGTYLGEEGGLPPIYNVKSEKSYGINLGLVTTYLPGSEHNGISMSLYHVQKGGTINGVNIGFMNKEMNPFENKKVNGLELSFLNINTSVKEKSNKIVNGAQIAVIANIAKEVNGLQATVLVNRAKEVNGAQIGIYNQIYLPNDKKKRGILLNYHFKGKDRK